MTARRRRRRGQDTCGGRAAKYPGKTVRYDAYPAARAAVASCNGCTPLSVWSKACNQGEFTRVLTLPFDVDAEKVEAVLKDGVLMVRLQKAGTAKPKQIAVKTS